MSSKQKLRENLSALPSLEHLAQRLREGWQPVAIEWERESAAAPAEPAAPVVEEIPYGLRIADDCAGLVEDLTERQTVIAALDMIVDDNPLSRVAAELNRRGYVTRGGGPWTPTALFMLLPRMIELGPRLFTSADWATRKQGLRRVV